MNEVTHGVRYRTLLYCPAPWLPNKEQAIIGASSLIFGNIHHKNDSGRFYISRIIIFFGNTQGIRNLRFKVPDIPTIQYEFDKSIYLKPKTLEYLLFKCQFLLHLTFVANSQFNHAKSRYSKKCTFRGFPLIIKGGGIAQGHRATCYT